jgi:molybdopterin converting factor subunit 1
MQLKIRAFGITRDICGDSVVRLDVPENSTAGDVRQRLIERFPGLAQLNSLLIAVNEEFAQPDLPVSAADEIALIPPVSGG